MTLDEAIIHAKEVSANQSVCAECQEEHKQLTEWLEELKMLREKSRWIPCSERMPEDNTDVIVCFYIGTVTEMRYWGNGIFQGIYEHTAKTIVAWMPLPEPYKGE